MARIRVSTPHASCFSMAKYILVHRREQCPVYCTLLRYIMTVEIACGQKSSESSERGHVNLHDPTICGR